MSYAAFGRAHDSVCHFKLAGHPARVCRHSVELATQVWLAEHLSRTFELPATPRTMHHAPCTTHHAPCTMHRFTVPCTAHGVPHTAGIYHRVLGTVHYAPRTLRHTTSLMGPFTARLSPCTTTMHHPRAHQATGTLYLCACPVRCRTARTPMG